MHLIDGKSLAANLRAELASEIRAFSSTDARLMSRPTLAILLVGDDPASHLYVALKEKAAQEIGVRTILERRAATSTDDELVDLIGSWNADSSVHAILVQLPLPEGHDDDRVIRSIDPKKDADGFHPDNRTALLAGNARIIPPVHEGILRLIAETPLRIHGSMASLIMKNDIFSEPLKKFLTTAGADVHVMMDPKSLDHAALSRSDLIIIAVGKPNTLNIAMTKPDAVLIDVGTTKTPDGKVRGDIDIDSYQTSDAWITPVPGGVGPVTIAMLLKNVVTLAKGQTTT